MFMGIDVAKAQLEFACQPSGDPGTVPNTEDGIRALVAHCQRLGPTLQDAGSVAHATVRARGEGAVRRPG